MGGYLTSVASFLEDYGAVPDTCRPYKSKDSYCNYECSVSG